jgi:hypothetical protein
MTLSLQTQEWDEIWEEATQTITFNPVLESFEHVSQLPQKFGRGSIKKIEVLILFPKQCDR